MNLWSYCSIKIAIFSAVAIAFEYVNTVNINCRVSSDVGPGTIAGPWQDFDLWTIITLWANVSIRLALLLLVQVHSDNLAVKRFSDFRIQKLNHDLKLRNDQKDIHEGTVFVLCVYVSELQHHAVQKTFFASKKVLPPKKNFRPNRSKHL